MSDSGSASLDSGSSGFDTACEPREEIPYNGEDEDCDGADLVDVDGDGWDAVREGGEDCDDADPDVNPDAEERCDNLVDDDCDDVTDEGCTLATAGPPDPGGIYWICGASAPAPAAFAFVAALLLVAARRAR